MIAMSLHYLLTADSGILKNKDIASSLWYIITFRTHVFFGLVGITLGPTQFISRIRTKYKRAHKLMGYLYVSSIILSSLSGLIIAPFAMGGWISTLGFSLLGTIWFYTTLKLIAAARTRDFHQHRMWSYFNYALTFAAITQRTLLLIPLLTSVPFMPIYQLSAWLPWLLNVGVAYALINRQP